MENFRDNPAQVAKCVSNTRFFTDAASGQLPSVTFVEPNFSVQSEENPQDVAFGENFLSQVVTALFESPQWRSTAMFVTYAPPTFPEASDAPACTFDRRDARAVSRRTDGTRQRSPSA